MEREAVLSCRQSPYLKELSGLFLGEASGVLSLSRLTVSGDSLSLSLFFFFLPFILKCRTCLDLMHSFLFNENAWVSMSNSLEDHKHCVFV